MGLAIQPTAAPPNPSFPALGRFGKYTHGNRATHETTYALELLPAPVVNNRLCDSNPSLSYLLAGVAGYGCEQGTGVCRERLKKIITLPRRAANAYGSYSASECLQAMVVSRGWVFAREGLRK